MSVRLIRNAMLEWPDRMSALARSSLLTMPNFLRKLSLRVFGLRCVSNLTGKCSKSMPTSLLPGSRQANSLNLFPVWRWIRTARFHSGEIPRSRSGSTVRIPDSRPTIAPRFSNRFPEKASIELRSSPIRRLNTVLKERPELSTLS